MKLRPILEAHGVFFGEDYPLDIEFIGHSLAHINRFAGRVGAYSVAQHSVLVSQALPRELKLSGLLHDAAEAYLGDIIGPVKAICPRYCDVESAVLDAVDSHFETDTRNAAVGVADQSMLVREARHFRIWNSRSFPWTPQSTVYDPLVPLVAEDALAWFLETYHALR